MKTLIILIYFLPYMAFAQFESSKVIYESPELTEAIASHKKIAILPFDVKIIYRKLPKNFSLKASCKQEEKMSASIQGSLYTYLLKRSADYTINLQNVDETNLMLKEAGMEGRLNEFTKEEIATVLGVDGIIAGRFETIQTQSDGVAIASMVLSGGGVGRTGTGSLTLTLNNGADGVLLWRFFKSMDETILGSSHDLVERMMRKVSRNFPYSNLLSK